MMNFLIYLLYLIKSIINFHKLNTLIYLPQKFNIFTPGLLSNKLWVCALRLRKINNPSKWGVLRWYIAFYMEFNSLIVLIGRSLANTLYKTTKHQTQIFSLDYISQKICKQTPIYRRLNHDSSRMMTFFWLKQTYFIKEGYNLFDSNLLNVSIVLKSNSNRKKEYKIILKYSYTNGETLCGGIWLLNGYNTDDK